LKYHLYINTSTSYASTPCHKNFGNVEVQELGLVGHSNVGLCGMDTTGDMGAIKKMWLSKGGVTAIVPLKLKKIWPITFDSRLHDGQFVCTLTKDILSSRTKAREYRPWTSKS
jgi:hypothetical protein